MQKPEIEKYIDSIEIDSTGTFEHIDEEEKAVVTDEPITVKTSLKSQKALTKDLIQFDLSALDFLH